MVINLSHFFQRKISRWGVGVTLRLRLPEPPGAAGQVPHVGPAQDLQARPADPPGRQEVGQEPLWRRLNEASPIDETVMIRSSLVTFRLLLCRLFTNYYGLSYFFVMTLIK